MSLLLFFSELGVVMFARMVNSSRMPFLKANVYGISFKLSNNKAGPFAQGTKTF